MVPELNRAQQREFRKMLLTIKNNSQKTGLLIAVCDDRNLQNQLIETYEAELEEAEVSPFRVRLDPKQPSVRGALQELVDKHQELAKSGAVVTVVNANELLGVRLTEEKSEQEKFFFSLQWTREALLRFKFPIVIWLTDRVATRLSQQAPDFWSWRTGFFEFLVPEPDLAPSPYLSRSVSEGCREGWGGVDAESPMTSLDAFATPDFTPLSPPLVRGETGSDSDSTNRLSVADVQTQITALEAIAKEQDTADSPLLITLYNELGDAYGRDYKYKLALEAYEKALDLAQSRKDKAGEARSLFKIANALRLADRPSQAIPYYEQAIELYEKSGDRQGEAASLNNLGFSYYSRSQYQPAINFLDQSLEIFRDIGDRQGEANSLGNLGNVYYSLGQYPQAIDFQQQWLRIAREIDDRHGEANSLGNLGLIYEVLGQYPQAIDCQQQSLEIKREIGDRQGEANSLSNLGNVYYAFGQYPQAIDFYQQSLEIDREIGNRQGESDSLGNLGLVYDVLGQYPKSIDCQRQSLEIRREISNRQGEATSLGHLGLVYRHLGQYQQALEFYRQAIPIKQEVGDRYGEANSTFNLGYALARIDQKWEAKIAFEQARSLYDAMGLEKKAKKCDAAIRDLGKEVVAIPKKTPTIGEEAPQLPDWWEKSLPMAESSGSAKPWEMPLWGWFVLGLLVVVAIAWTIGS